MSREHFAQVSSVTHILFGLDDALPQQQYCVLVKGVCESEKARKRRARTRASEQASETTRAARQIAVRTPSLLREHEKPPPAEAEHVRPSTGAQVGLFAACATRTVTMRNTAQMRPNMGICEAWSEGAGTRHKGQGR